MKKLKPPCMSQVSAYDYEMTTSVQVTGARCRGSASNTSS